MARVGLPAVRGLASGLFLGECDGPMVAYILACAFGGVATYGWKMNDGGGCSWSLVLSWKNEFILLARTVSMIGDSN